MDEMLNGKNPQADARLLNDIANAPSVEATTEASTEETTTNNASRLSSSAIVEELGKRWTEVGEMTGMLNVLAWLRRKGFAEAYKQALSEWDEIKSDETYR